MPQAILCCSPDASAALIDLPTSIANAQKSSRELRSTSPVSQPFVTPEPKGAKRDRLLASLPVTELETHKLIQSTLQTGLSIIREHWHSSHWCLERPPLDPDLHRPIASLVKTNKTHHGTDIVSSDRAPPLVLSSITNIVRDVDDLRGTVVYNVSNSTTDLHVPGLGSFYVPPCSIFLNSTIEAGYRAFEQASRANPASENKQKIPQLLTFDLVLLDPPWSNRSVRHSRAYLSAELQQSDPFQQVIPILRDYLNPNGYVAIWVTNKTAIRDQVVDEFVKLNLKLLEEWVWLKITMMGDPIMPLDGLWRKPYESLLLFSRRPDSVELERRTILAVPDLHSRKPNLKPLFEVFMPENYHALELFARSLTAGWWSWGNEALKFQHESYWT